MRPPLPAPCRAAQCTPHDASPPVSTSSWLHSGVRCPQKRPDAGSTGRVSELGASLTASCDCRHVSSVRPQFVNGDNTTLSAREASRTVGQHCSSAAAPGCDQCDLVWREQRRRLDGSSQLRGVGASVILSAATHLAVGDTVLLTVTEPSRPGPGHGAAAGVWGAAGTEGQL